MSILARRVAIARKQSYNMVSQRLYWTVVGELFVQINLIKQSPSHTPRKPHEIWGAYWPGGLTDPSRPGEEEEEADSERQAETHRDRQRQKLGLYGDDFNRGSGRVTM